MKTEDIENAAKNEAEELAYLTYYGGSAISQEDVENAFVKGAYWRINSVWHDVKDIPKESSAILAIRPDGSTEIVYFINLLRWRSLIKRCGFVQWAYIKDLIPNKEGEQ